MDGWQAGSGFARSFCDTPAEVWEEAFDRGALTPSVGHFGARKQLTSFTVHAVLNLNGTRRGRRAMCGNRWGGEWQPTATVPVNCPGCLRRIRARA